MCLDFSHDFQILFSLGQFKKNHEKNFFEKGTIFCKKFSQVLTYDNFFSKTIFVVILPCYI